MFRFRRSLTPAAVAAAIVVMSLGGTAPANAAEQAGTMPAGSITAAADSAVCAAGVPASEARAASVRPVDIDCFSSEEAAIEFVTGLVVDGPLTRAQIDAFNDGSDAVGTGSRARALVAPAASVLLGIEYADAARGGASWYLYGSSGSGCGGGTTYGFPSMLSGWDNRVSSADAYAGCRSQHYEGTSYTGSSVSCNQYCSGMGGLNDATSSIVFRQS
ncbi:hypothetical protein [Compostimonas suwonensis]|uniref:Peptidase inhibitor family I36 n=1 Tax=Compostimonas suwonensis TaxID=1048394 RepID=A0A2M9C095_9MICO|nr:hypothetical protein [Compostimonas suwonensis]PJJ63730.1 hypothetical protein CLV54_1404 [Compostimonas suwonensis]